MTRPGLPVLALAVMLGWAASAHPAFGQAANAAESAPAPRGGVAWSTLSDADREALSDPIRERWERADAEQQQRLLERARFWASLSPEQKRMARAGVQRWDRSDAQQRRGLREIWARMQALPPAERQAAREAWDQLGPRQRRAWLDAGGPGVSPPPEPDAESPRQP